MPSAQTFVRDVGNDALSNIRRRVRAVEFTFAEFQSSKIGTFEGTRTNLATFKELDNRVPKSFSLRMKTSPVPTGWKEIWSGKMLVEGKESDVIAYRKQ